jgi:hypothetical protein
MSHPGPEASAAGTAPRAEVGRIAGTALAGALFAAAGAAALGLTLGLFERTPGPAREAAAGLREFLNAGGWIRLPLWGATLGALRALGWVRGPGGRSLALGIAFGCLVLAALPRPDVREGRPGGAVGNVRMSTRSARGPDRASARAAAIRRWAYRSPDGVRHILALGHDPDPVVREQVALALGVNLIVSDLEHAGPDRPARHAALPLRDSVRAGLLGLMLDPSEAVRAEAARALWKAPAAFGSVPAAAETLAAVLGRAGGEGPARPPERLAWLALDAAAGAPHAGLKRAAAVFAATTTDSELRRAALVAAGPSPVRR